MPTILDIFHSPWETTRRYRGQRDGRNGRAIVSAALLCQIFIVAVFVSGCGVPASIEFPDRLIGSDGQLFTVEDLERIAQNDNLSTEQKEQMFRDLGIEDEQLIQALLEL
ncbi:MAG: hypothetical protein ACPGXK_15965 [Phycisphaerae bacterium]